MSRAARCLYKPQRQAKRKASSYVRDRSTKHSAVFQVADLRRQLGENSRWSQLGSTKLVPGNPDKIKHVDYVQFNKKRPPVISNEMIKVKRDLFGGKFSSKSLKQNLKESLKLKKSELDKISQLRKFSTVSTTTPSISGTESTDSIVKVSSWISSQTFANNINSAPESQPTKFELNISEPERMESDSDIGVFSIPPSPNFISDQLTEPVGWQDQNKRVTRDSWDQVKGVTSDLHNQDEGMTRDWHYQDKGVIRDWRDQDKTLTRDWHNQDEGVTKEWYDQDTMVTRYWQDTDKGVSMDWIQAELEGQHEENIRRKDWSEYYLPDDNITEDLNLLDELYCREHSREEMFVPEINWLATAGSADVDGLAEEVNPPLILNKSSFDSPLQFRFLKPRLMW